MREEKRAGLLLGFGGFPEETLREGVERTAALFEELDRGGWNALRSVPLRRFV